MAQGYWRGIAGTATNDSAAAGVVGQIIEATVAVGSAVALTTATPANITSVSLTAGDWEVDGFGDFNLGSATTTEFRLGISATSATLPTQAGGSGIDSDPLLVLPLSTTTFTGVVGLRTGSVRVSLASTTTVYLVAQQTFSAGTSGAFGTLKARRAR